MPVFITLTEVYIESSIGVKHQQFKNILIG
jgi:hypothetical protein